MRIKIEIKAEDNAEIINLVSFIEIKDSLVIITCCGGDQHFFPMCDVENILIVD